MSNQNEDRVITSADLHVTDSQTWKKASRQGAKLVMPSSPPGDRIVAIVRNPGLHVFIERGMIPNPLLGTIQKAIKAGQQGEQATVTNLMQDIDSSDLKMIAEVTGMIDDVVIFSVIQPRVYPIKDQEGKFLHPDDRDEDKLYIDEIDDVDKTFIFQFACGGTRDVEKFRQQQGASLAAVQSGQNMEPSAEPITGIG